MSEAFYEVREVPFPTKEPGPGLLRFSQYHVRECKTKYVKEVLETEAEADLLAAKRNYMRALRAYSDWAQSRSEGYDLDIERDSQNRIGKRNAHQAVAKRALEENARVEGFDHRIRAGKFLKP